MYRLIFLSGRMKGRRVAVQQGTLTIGRDPTCQIDLADDEQVSRQHATIEQRKDGVWVKDLGALNKTVVNGQPVDEVRLRHGDKIEIGHTQLEYQVIETTTTGPRRRVGRVQVLTFLAIALVLGLQAVVVFLFPIWQGEEAVPPPTLVAAGTNAADSGITMPDLPVTDPAPTGTPAGATSGPPDAVAAEVQELRAAVAGLREQLQGMAGTAGAETGAPPPVAPSEAPVEPAAIQPGIDQPAPEPERPPVVDPLQDRAREILAMARDEVQRANFVAADQYLERVQLMAPDFLPAYVERARLYEKRGMTARAGEQWTQVMDRSMGTPLYNEAAAERQRLARAEALAKMTKPAETPRQAASRLPRRVRIVSVDRERFQGNREFDEMRVVRVNLKPRLSEGALDGDDVEVLVSFYDRVAGTDTVVPTGATVPEDALRVEGPWGAGEQRTVTATFVLPKGFRQDERDTVGEQRVYEGYRVRVYYKRELQDEDALPRSLLELAPPELPEPVPSSASRPVPAR